MQHTTAAPVVPPGSRRVEAFRLSGDHGPAAIARFLPPPSDPEYLPVLADLIRADLAHFANRGEPRLVQDYYRDFPALASAPEVDLWRPTNLSVTPAPIRMPAALGTSQTAIRPFSSTPAGDSGAAEHWFPEVGQTFAGFRLVEELGQGGFGKVFLAEEPRLADRRVVLKITPQASSEPERLARLQHTNIVPIQNAFRTDGLTALQMPYFGRQTLADVIAFVRDEGDLRRAGGQVFSTTVARQSTSRRPQSDRPSSPGMPRVAPAAAVPAPPPDEPHPIREMLARMSYTDAVVWLIARVADGLSHAHARGILHLDLKPANVLFSDDGQPMLLDFNLGYDTGRQDRERIGGTWPYMAPEQIREYAAEPGAVVDARTDLYALGILFYELLTCRLPFPAVERGPAGLAAAVAVRLAGAPSVQEHNPAVPPAIDAIIRKLLAPNPARRYQSADELRADLELHRENRPLRYAPNPSVRELAVKWQRRHPRMLSNLLFVACLTVVAGLGAAALHLSAVRAQDRAARTAQEFRATLATLRVDLASPGDADLRREALKSGAGWLARYGVPADRAWADVPLVRDLPADDRPAVADGLGELSVLLAHAEMLDARTAAAEDRKRIAARAAGWNRAAEAWFATTRAPAVLWEQRTEIADAVDDAKLRATIPADRPGGEATRTDLYVRAVAHAAAGEFGRAVPLLAELADREKDHFAANFALAYSYHMTSQHQRALERYQMARALAPRDYRPSYNRGLVLLFLRRYKEAEIEFTDGLVKKPDHADGLWSRAIARRRLDDAAGAIDDLTRAMDAGYPRLSALLVRAEMHEKKKEEAAAAADRAAAEKLEPRVELEFITRGLMRLETDPAAALADFEQAIEMNPRSLTGWENRAIALGDRLGRLEDGVESLATAVEFHPEYAPARMNMAVFLARLGRRSDAHREAGRALVLSADPYTIYQAACVYSLTSTDHSKDRDQALAFLRQSLREGYRDFEHLANDADLANIRDLPEFEQAVAAAKELSR